MDSLQNGEEDVAPTGHLRVKPISKETIHQICSGQTPPQQSRRLSVQIKRMMDEAPQWFKYHLSKTFRGRGLAFLPARMQFGPPDPLALKHHTSKLNDFEGLLSVATFGFRGEALSSLCAIADLSVTTRTASDAIGTRLVFDASGKLTEQSPTSRQVGTTVSLSNLFRSLPVRRKEFSTHAKREVHKMVSRLHAYALISNGVRISVLNTISAPGGRGTTLLDTLKATGSLKDNISTIFGLKQSNGLFCIDRVDPSEEHLLEFGVSSTASLPRFDLRGFISSPGHGMGRSAADRQFYYINSRPADSPKVSRLVNEMYRSLNRHQSPFVLLDILVDRASTDINVTPDKRRILLIQEGVLLATVKTSLLRAFGSGSSSSPSITLDRHFSLTVVPEDRSSFSSSSPTSSSPSSAAEPLSSQEESSSQESSQGSVACGSTRSFLHSRPRTLPTTSGDGTKLNSVLSSFKRRSSSDPLGSLSRKQSKLDRPQITAFFSQANRPRKDNQRKDLQDDRQTQGEDPETEAKVVVDSMSTLSPSTSKDRGGSFSSREEVGRPTVEENSSWDDGMLEQNSQGTISSFTETLEDGSMLVVESLSLPDVESSGVRQESLETEEGSPGATQGLLGARGMSPGASQELLGATPAAEEDTLQVTASEAQFVPRVRINPLNGFTEISSQGDRPKLRILPPKDDEDKAASNPSVEVDWDKILGFSNGHTEDTNDSGELEPRRFLAGIEGENAEAELQKELRKESFGEMKVLGQFNKGFIVCRLGEDLFLVDQHAADEKSNFEALEKSKTSLQTQRLIRPQPLNLTPINEALLMDHLEVFHRNGFQFKIDEDSACGRRPGPSGSRVFLTHVPVSRETALGKGDVEELLFMLEDSGGVFAEGRRNLRPSRVRSLLASRACRSSVMVGTALTHSQMQRIVSGLAQLDQPWNCPHGRPTIRHLVNLNML
ncbi:unnamed protein product [Cyprideis torosa]|uniref:Uncharacterized protein n=1 Tax=Cyprideis torosa TaxID=163714 RepID=A0A7R8W596_9CRUS|nr:unnamed protein product [Cyprideis torosa]CAG0884917.1 unnamed protein product [Cyprideis torosa]